MTERERQVVSFAYGNTRMENPRVTREMAEQAVRRGAPVDKATEFLELIGIEKLIDDRIKDHLAQLLLTFRERDDEPIEEILQREKPQRACVIVRDALQSTRGLLRDRIIAVYSTYFSDEEFDALAAFYKTSVGQRLLEVGGPITVAITEAADGWSEAAMQAHQADLQEVLGDLVNIAHSPR